MRGLEFGSKRKFNTNYRSISQRILPLFMPQCNFNKFQARNIFQSFNIFKKKKKRTWIEENSWRKR